MNKFPSLKKAVETGKWDLAAKECQRNGIGVQHRSIGWQLGCRPLRSGQRAGLSLLQLQPSHVVECGAVVAVELEHLPVLALCPRQVALGEHHLGQMGGETDIAWI